MEIKKITLLLIVVFALSATSLYAQQRISRDGLGHLLHQMYFDFVPENEFNQVFQNFMRSNYPRQNIFDPEDVKEVTANFILSFLYNEAVMDKWNQYADAAKAKKEEQSKPTAQQQPQPNQTQPNQPQTNANTTVNDRSGWNIANLDTARNVYYLSDLEKDIIL
ncbi:MAG: hypothetical protein LBC76_05585, partial [Treponema sp.]|nr:hypothetical protein [Treponema sp.]